MITAGTYRARATGNCVLGESALKGTPFIELYLSVVGGEFNGTKVKWTSYFTDTVPKNGGDTPAMRTIGALQLMGWRGDDVSEFSDGELHGLDSCEVDIVVELEDYEGKDGEKRTSAKVKWVNKPGGRLNLDQAMNGDKAQAFGERMRGLVLAAKSRLRPDPGAIDFEFGANAPSSGEEDPEAWRNAPSAPATPSTPGRKAF